jgi:hypothetical protein
LEVRVKCSVSIEEGSGSVPHPSVNDTVSKRQSASGLLESFQCYRDKEGRVDVPRKRADD